MKSRLSQMKSLVQPIEDFGTAVGQALAEMKDDAESANKAIKSALKSMLESWGKMAVNDVNTQMWKAINDAAAKRGRAKAQPDIDAARANAKANAVKSIEDFNFLVNFIATTIDVENFFDKVELLKYEDLKVRAMKLLNVLDTQVELLKIKQEINSKVKNEIDQQQKCRII